MVVTQKSLLCTIYFTLVALEHFKNWLVKFTLVVELIIIDIEWRGEEGLRRGFERLKMKNLL
jgi:hypothetical protein